MTRANTREKLLEAGLDTLHRLGFNGCGVQEIVQAAGVPKGSFYNHFDSKEALGAEVLERYWQRRTDTALSILDDAALSPLERLRRYFAQSAEGLAARGFVSGCLLGNLAAELSDQSALVSDRLCAIFRDWTGRVETCLRGAQESGELDAAADVATLAAFVLNAWEGAILRARIDKDAAALAHFDDIVFNKLLRRTGS